MKNMPGMENIQSMLSKMGMGGGKVNTGAMESQLNQRLKIAKTKERIRAKAELNAKAREDARVKLETFVKVDEKPKMTDEEVIQFMNAGEKPERTPRGSKPDTNNKKKKGKK
jgi:hypothetical protein